MGPTIEIDSDKLGIVAQACDSSTWKVEAGESEVQGQPQLYSSRLAWATGHPIFKRGGAEEEEEEGRNDEERRNRKGHRRRRKEEGEGEEEEGRRLDWKGNVCGRAELAAVALPQQGLPVPCLGRAQMTC